MIWLNHHRLLAMVSRIDNGLFWLNANLLLWTSFIPFPTALMGDYPANRLAVSFYGGVMFLMALGFVLARWHLHRHLDLLQEDVDRAAFRTGTRYSIVMGPVLRYRRRPRLGEPDRCLHLLWSHCVLLRLPARGAQRPFRRGPVNER